MKQILFQLLTLFTTTAGFSQSCNLFFSEYLEGSSSNKAIEVYNPLTTSVNLSDYKIYRYNNGSSTPTDSLQMQGILAPGGVFVAGNANSIASILAVSDTIHTITLFNGDDAMALRHIPSNTTLDVIGVIGVDPGANWVVGLGATSEFTLVRKFANTNGETNWSTSSTEWDVYPSNTATYLGSHSALSCCTVNETPTITLGTVTNISTSSTSFSLPFTATTGSPNQYSITTGTPTALPSFTAVNNATLGTSPIAVNIPASAANTYNFVATVRNSTTTCVSVASNFTVVVTASPTIITSGSLSSFTACAGTGSAEQSFTVRGFNLTANILVTPPTGFEVSTTSGSGFASSVTLTQSSGAVSTTTIYVRLASSATGTPSGNITSASSGATTQNVAASGTINALPTITLGAVTSVNNSATSFSLPYSATTGSPNQYSITTGSPTAMTSFSAVTNASLPSSPISVTIPASVSNTYDFNLTVRNSTTGCISANNGFTLTVGGLSINANLSDLALSSGTLNPSFASSTITYAATVVNATTSITVTPTKEDANATIQVRVNSGSYATVTSGNPSSALSLNVGSNIVDVLVTAQDGTANKNYTITVTRESLFIWTGATSNVWNLATNWNPAQIPSSTDDVIIATSSNNPILSITNAVRNITINYGATLTVSGTLQIGGNLSNLGALNALNGTLVLNGLTAQTFNANGALVQNLTINNAAGVSLTDSLNLTGTLTPTAGVLTTGGFLTLKSSASSTASIASNVSGNPYISGNVIVERFITRRRAFRFLASPVNTSNFISGNWQLATHITGSLTGQNGFDQTNTGNASLFTYQLSNEAWTTIPNTNATNLTIGTGYRMLVRGDRNINLNSTIPPDSVSLVLRATGTILMGNVVFGGGSVSSSPAGIPALNAAIGSGANNSTIGWSLIGNPYACAVDWSNVTKSNVSSTFATWNVNNAGRGSYVYHNGSAGTGFGASNIINSGQSIFVQTTAANPSITFTETSKVTSTPPSHFKKGLTNVLNIDIFIGDRAYDALTVLFDANNSNEYDANDFIKLVNPEINFYSYLSDGTRLAMNNMREFGTETVVPLGLDGVFNGGSYELKFSNQNTFTNAELKLKDKFLNKMYDLKSINNLTFTVSSDSNSFGKNRFELIFSKSATGINSELSSNNNNFIVFPNPANNVLNLSLTTTQEDNYSYAILNQLGAEISNGQLDLKYKRTHALNIENLSNGVYFIQVKNGQSSQIIKFIK